MARMSLGVQLAWYEGGGWPDTRGEWCDVTTYSRTLPPPMVSRFLKLLEAVDEFLFEVTESVRQRLVEELAKSDRAEGARPTLIYATELNSIGERSDRPIPPQTSCTGRRHR